MTYQARSAITLNETNLATLGFTDDRPDGVLDGLARTFPSETLAGQEDRLPMSDRAAAESREITIAGTLAATSIATLTTALDVFKWFVSRKDLRLATLYDTSRYYLVDCERFVATGIDPVLVNPVARITMTFRAQKVPAFATADTVTAFTTNTAIALGSAISRGVITVTASGGASTNPTLTLKNSAGTTLETMVFTVSLPTAGDVLTIDCARRTITKTISSVTTNAIAALNSSTTCPTFFGLDPDDGNLVTPAYPSLTGAAGTGSATFSISYRKRWK